MVAKLKLNYLKIHFKLLYIIYTIYGKISHFLNTTLLFAKLNRILSEIVSSIQNRINHNFFHIIVNFISFTSPRHYFSK